jgi:hypothetical protein
VYPKQDTVTVNTSFVAQEGSPTDASVVPFQKVVMEKTVRTEVPAKGSEKVSEKAQGTVTIYNSFSTTPQRLIKNTRFMADDGHVFRIRDSVEVPGKKSDGSAGELQVMVYAEEAGEAYNIPPTHFSIPGFKGKPQEKDIYAKSSEAMKGGFEGERRVVEETTRTQALATLEKQAREELLGDLVKDAKVVTKGNTSPDTLFFKEAVFFTMTPSADEVVNEKTVAITLSAKAEAILFPKEAFAERIARDAVAGYSGNPLHLEGTLDDLSVRVQAIAPQTGNASSSAPSAVASVGVTVQGKAHFVWDIDTARFAQDLAGKEKSSIAIGRTSALLQGHPGIDRVDASIRPFWKTTFPTDPKEITVNIKLDSGGLF